MTQVRITGVPVDYYGAHESIPPEEQTAIYDYGPHREAASDHPRMRRAVVDVPVHEPRLRWLAALHWDDGTDLAALDERVAAGATSDPALDRALICSISWTRCTRCTTCRVLARTDPNLPGADAIRQRRHTLSSTCPRCGQPGLPPYAEDVTTPIVMRCLTIWAWVVLSAVVALTFTTLTVLGLLDDQHPLPWGYAALMLTVGFVPIVAEYIRHTDAVLIDGSRLGRRTGLRRRSYGWVEESDIVKVVRYRHTTRRVGGPTGRAYQASGGYYWLAVWARGRGQRLWRQLIPVPARRFIPAFYEDKRLLAAQGISPLMIPIARLSPHDQQLLEAFFATFGHTIEVKHSR